MRFAASPVRRLVVAGCLALGLGLAGPALAQDNNLDDRYDVYLSSQREPIRVVVGAVYQQYQDLDDTEVTQLSTPVAVFVPIGRRLGLSVATSYATAEGDELESVSGLSDVQVGASFYQRIGAGSLVLNVGVNVPVGEREFSADEYTTAVVLGQHYFDFRVPSYGQGLNIAPGLTLAYPVSERVAVGVGVAYQNRGGFRPVDGLNVDYDPGDEVVVTGGFDVKLSRISAFSADVSYTMFDADALGDVEVFTPGDKLVLTGQLLGRPGRSLLQLVGRYRTQGNSTFPIGPGLAVRDLQVLPAQTLIRGLYRPRLADALSVGLLAQARIFEETDLFEALTLTDVGILPTFHFGSVALETRFIYTSGDVSGFEAGGGLSVRL